MVIPTTMPGTLMQWRIIVSTMGGSAFIGYRYMNIDFASGSYSYDAEEQGPMLGVSIYW